MPCVRRRSGRSREGLPGASVHAAAASGTGHGKSEPGPPGQGEGGGVGVMVTAGVVLSASNRPCGFQSTLVWGRKLIVVPPFPFGTGVGTITIDTSFL